MGNAFLLPMWTDVTDRDRFLSRMFERSPNPLAVIDVRGRLREVNAAMEHLSGMSRAQLIGAELAACFQQAEQVREVLQRVGREGAVHDCAWTLVHGHGNVIEVAGDVILDRNDAGKAQGVFVALRNLTDLRQYEAQMLFQASYDALTALPNRRWFRDRLELAMAQARRHRQLLGVLFIDLDNFKDINDTLGHFIGDEVLKAVAWQLVASQAKTDVVARMGGDEFAVLIEDAGSVALIEQRMENFLRAVAQPCIVEDHEVVVSCSIGGTIFPCHNGDAETLLRSAEAAMYRAKDDGKNRFQLYTADIDAAIQRRADISHRLRTSLKKSEFMLHYQPRVALGSGRVTGVEALLRWQAAGAGMISPADFIPVAERNGMIVPIGEWVLFEACRQARQWQLEMGTPVNMAVNLSARQLRDVDIVALVVRALDETGLPAHLLELELTESMLMHDTQRVLRTLEALKEIGVSLAIDDFGTGYSSLSYLKRFPLDYLKIDKSFVTDLPHDPNDAAIVQAIMVMAHSLGLVVIAEGVETHAQLDFLLAQDCDQMQGYLFSKPLPKDELAKLLAEDRNLGSPRPGKAVF